MEQAGLGIFQFVEDLDGLRGRPGDHLAAFSFQEFAGPAPSRADTFAAFGFLLVAHYPYLGLARKGLGRQRDGKCVQPPYVLQSF